MENIDCNLCGHEQFKFIYKVKDTNYGTPGTFEIVQCQHCDLVFLNPRPTIAEISAHYPTETYHPFRAIQSQEEVRPAPLHLRRASYLTDLKKSGRVLDVGCGSGLFLLAMQQKGWVCEGVEPNKSAAEFAQKSLHLDVDSGDIFIKDTAHTYELITLWDVLEHTHSPKEVLEQAHKLLKPGGYLAVNVPNWGGFERQIFRERWIALDAPRHLYHFTPKTLTSLLKLCDFMPVMVKAQAPPLSLASNTLRWAGDSFLRGGQAKVSINNLVESESPSTSMPTNRQLIIKLTHQVSRLPNAIANTVNRGAGITAVSQKVS